MLDSLSNAVIRRLGMKRNESRDSNTPPHPQARLNEPEAWTMQEAQ